jgi:hypothetical protein
MKTLTATDASLLAMLADKPSLPKEQRKRMLARLSPAARPIAEAMNGGGVDGAAVRRSSAVRVASGLREWSASNKDAAIMRVQRRIKART